MTNEINLHYSKLSRRERQIMDILHEEHPQSAKGVMAKLPDPPSYSSVRALIARLVEKGVVRFEVAGTKHMYIPVQGQAKVQGSAISRLIKTFFKGSKINAITALLEADGEVMTAQEIAVLERKITQLKQQAK